MQTILLAIEHLPEETRTRIKALAPNHRLLATRDEDAIRAAWDEIEIAGGDVGIERLLAMPRLRWYQQWGAGADWIMEHPEAQGKDWIVTNASGLHAIPISEHIFTLMLALARRIPEAVQAQERHAWVRSGGLPPIFELAGKTLVLIGVGAIGERTARIAEAMEMRVIGVRRDPDRPAQGVARMVGPDQLDKVLPEADLVVLTVPLTPETQQMIGPRQLALMKPTACIINIGRGGTIDQDALIEALNNGQIGGAGLDVTDPEPLPADSPLWDAPNTLITGHYAGSTPVYQERALAIFQDNLARYIAGQPLRNRLDLSLGIRVS
jgi:phosphoglycerate dehydrogenase-like enzyme